MGAGFAIAAAILIATYAGQASAETGFIGKLMTFDSAGKEVMLHHGPLDALGLPAQSSVFRLENFELLKGIAPGDIVKVEATAGGTVPSILRIEKTDEEYDDHHH